MCEEGGHDDGLIDELFGAEMGWMGREGTLGEEVLLFEICGLRGVIFLLRGGLFRRVV